jgi:hypothetical protein
MWWLEWYHMSGIGNQSRGRSENWILRVLEGGRSALGSGRKYIAHAADGR